MGKKFPRPCATCGAEVVSERRSTKYCRLHAVEAMRRTHAQKHIDWLMEFASKAKPDACLIWPKSKDRSGYGYTSLNNRTVKAHRAIFILVRQPEAPPLVIMHSCDNPSCVNPHHLVAGTQLENVADAIRKNRRQQCGNPGRPRPARAGGGNPAAKLTEEDVKSVRASNDSHASAAARLGVSKSLIASIRSGRSWRHVL